MNDAQLLHQKIKEALVSSMEGHDGGCISPLGRCEIDWDRTAERFYSYIFIHSPFEIERKDDRDR